MKIAICISGEPRLVEECFPLIKKNIIDVNPPIDFFIHTWYDPTKTGQVLYENAMSSFASGTIKEGVDEIIENLYHPKRLEIEWPKEFKNSNLDFSSSIDKYFAGYAQSGLSKEEYANKRMSNIYSMWYSAMQVIKLKKEYELENNFTYDVVVKFRFDNIVNHPIHLTAYDPNFMHYQDMGQPDGMISDWMNLSSSENMDVYGCIFNLLEPLARVCIKKHHAFSSESLIRAIIDKFNILPKPASFGLTLPRNGKL